MYAINQFTSYKSYDESNSSVEDSEGKSFEINDNSEKISVDEVDDNMDYTVEEIMSRKI